MEKFTTKSAKETQQVGENLAHQIFASTLTDKAVVLALSGDLGAGKTTFLQGFARGLGIDETVLSPTFVVMKRFALKNSIFKNFYHIDCYRLENKQDLEVLGIIEILQNKENIIALEWPERVSGLLHKKTTITFNHVNENEREIIIQ